jgi:acyl-CoA thioester hydrolase
MNVGAHVDNVEALRILDEARLLFFRHAPLTDDGRRGLLRDVPRNAVELVASQRVDYRAEMRFAAYQPFLVRIWVSDVARASVSISSELRIAPEHPPAIVAETSMVFWDNDADAAWTISEEVREALAAYAGEPVALRERPGR